MSGIVRFTAFALRSTHFFMHIANFCNVHKNMVNLPQNMHIIIMSTQTYICKHKYLKYEAL